MSYTPNFSKLNEDKFRIFVDGSYNKYIGMGAISYCFPRNFKGKKIVATQYEYSKLFQTDSSVDMEIMALHKGITILKDIVNNNLFLKNFPLSLKSDCIFVIKYINKGRKEECDIHEYSESQILAIQDIQTQLKVMKSEGLNIRISYIPTKINFAHHYCYTALRKKFNEKNKK